jgi:hypothetical protein
MINAVNRAETVIRNTLIKPPKPLKPTIIPQISPKQQPLYKNKPVQIALNAITEYSQTFRKGRVESKSIEAGIRKVECRAANVLTDTYQQNA